MTARRLLTILFFALLLAGCGGDDDSGGSSGDGSGEVTKAEFIKQADKACTDFREKSAQLEKQADQIPQNEIDRLAPLLRQLSDAAEETFADFDKLEVPAGDEEVIDRYLAANRAQIDVIEKTADAFESGDMRAATKLLSSGQDAGDKTRQIAQDYGFKVCGSESG